MSKIERKDFEREETAAKEGLVKCRERNGGG